jgi:hypothetical protein
VGKKLCALSAKRYRIKHPERVAEIQKKYRLKNKDKIKNYYEKNYEKIKIYRSIHCRKQYNTSIQYKLQHQLRNRINSAIKNNQKAGSAIKDLGCTIDELKIWIEKQFQPGMSWNNWSHTGWHIDHRLPLANFDLTNREQFLIVVHYTNLQPMWAEENIKKKNKIFN